MQGGQVDLYADNKLLQMKLLSLRTAAIVAGEKE
jgi:hypothetical protein